ncbi:hypothetical protein GF420_00345 [candidate division GN15 bacterium]|nr:hypothetical protein [candidate division GN15 bacterium]
MLREFQESDYPAVLEFLDRWNPDHPELGEGDILRWQHCYKWVSEYKGQIVGFIVQIPHIFRYGEPSGQRGEERIGWGVTLVLDMSEDFKNASLRRSAWANELLTAVEKNPPWQFSGIAMVGDIERVYARRGLTIRPDCAMMYARFLRPRKNLAYLGKSSLLAPGIGVLNALRPAPRADVRQLGLRQIDEFDASDDARWDALLNRAHELYGVRDAAFLNYKLSQPNRDYHVLVHPDGGYIIYRLAQHRTKDMKLVKVCDLTGTKETKLDLLRPAMQFAYDTNAYGIVAVGGVEEHDVYRRAGLWISRRYNLALPPHITARMRVTFFDGDLDNLW